MTTNQKKLETYRAGNLEAARLILENIKRYGGEESLMVRWARLVAANAGDRATAEKGLPLWRAA